MFELIVICYRLIELIRYNLSSRALYASCRDLILLCKFFSGLWKPSIPTIDSF